MVFCKILTQISIWFGNLQSSNWFKNSVILFPIPDDLNKNSPKMYFLTPFLFCFDQFKVHTQCYFIWNVVLHYVIFSWNPAWGCLHYYLCRTPHIQYEVSYHESTMRIDQAGAQDYHDFSIFKAQIDRSLNNTRWIFWENNF